MTNSISCGFDHVWIDWMYDKQTNKQTVYTKGNKIGHSIFSAWTDTQYIKWIFIVA